MKKTNSTRKNDSSSSSSSLAPKVMTGLSKISLALKNQMRADGARKGLHPTQLQILLQLLHANEPLRLTAIADALGLTAATVSDSVKALVEKSLVRKAGSLEDRRATSISLTASGRREAQRSEDWPEFLLSAVGELSSEEQSIFYRALLKMIRSLQEKGKIPVSRMCITCAYFRPNAHEGSSKPHHCALVDAALGDSDLRIECLEHQPAPKLGI